MQRGVAIAAVLAVMLSACVGVPQDADPTDTGRTTSVIPHPDGPDEVVLRVTVGGGFVPAEFNLTELPMFSLFGDGKVVTPGPQIAIYPAPALPNLQQRQVSESGIQQILAAATEAGLEGPDRTLTNDRIADAPTTVFTVVTDDDTHTTSAYALGIDTTGENGTVDDREARGRLRRFRERLGGLEQWLQEEQVGAEQQFEPRRMRVFVKPGTPEPSEPGLEQPEHDWPLPGDLAGFGGPGSVLGYRCGVVEGEDLRGLIDAAQRANQLTPWVSEGRTYSVLFRPLLPDESGCPEPADGEEA